MKIWYSILSVALLLSLSGCGGSSSAAPEPKNPRIVIGNDQVGSDTSETIVKHLKAGDRAVTSISTNMDAVVQISEGGEHFEIEETDKRHWTLKSWDPLDAGLYDVVLSVTARNSGYHKTVKLRYDVAPIYNFSVDAKRDDINNSVDDDWNTHIISMKVTGSAPVEEGPNGYDVAILDSTWHEGKFEIDLDWRFPGDSYYDDKAQDWRHKPQYVKFYFYFPDTPEDATIPVYIMTTYDMRELKITCHYQGDLKYTCDNPAGDPITFDLHSITKSTLPIYGNLFAEVCPSDKKNAILGSCNYTSVIVKFND